MLKSKGVEVIEYADDYSKAVEEERKNSDLNPKSYFVDDENSGGDVVVANDQGHPPTDTTG